MKSKALRIAACSGLVMAFGLALFLAQGPSEIAAGLDCDALALRKTNIWVNRGTETSDFPGFEGQICSDGVNTATAIGFKIYSLKGGGNIQVFGTPGSGNSRAILSLGEHDEVAEHCPDGPGASSVSITAGSMDIFICS